MRSRASSLIIVSSPFTREDTYLNTTIKREMVHFWGSPSILGIAEFIVPTGSFFHAQTHVSFHIIEELSPNVRMSHFMSLYTSMSFPSSAHSQGISSSLASMSSLIWVTISLFG